MYMMFLFLEVQLYSPRYVMSHPLSITNFMRRLRFSVSNADKTKDFWRNCVISFFIVNFHTPANAFKQFVLLLKVNKRLNIKVHIFSEGHKILRNLHLTLSHVVPVKCKVEISQKIVAFSEYMNFTSLMQHATCITT